MRNEWEEVVLGIVMLYIVYVEIVFVFFFYRFFVVFDKDFRGEDMGFFKFFWYGIDDFFVISFLDYFIYFFVFEL